MKLTYIYTCNNKIKYYHTKNKDTKQVISALQLIENANIKLIDIKEEVENLT